MAAAKKTAASKADEAGADAPVESAHEVVEAKPIASKGKKLASAVYVGGQVFLPGDIPSAEFAALITNPKAWAGKSDAADGDDN